MSSIAVTGPQGPLYQAAYTYDDASQVTAIASSTHADLNVTYDANGNLASATTRTPDCVQVGRLMSWDSEDRLAWVSAGGKTTRAAGDQSLLTKYIYAGPMLVAKREADGTPRWYHQDHLSSTVAMSDATGALARKTECEAFGQ
jgi:YD repeat-containing protein